MAALPGQNRRDSRLRPHVPCHAEVERLQKITLKSTHGKAGMPPRTTSRYHSHISRADAREHTPPNMIFRPTLPWRQNRSGDPTDSAKHWTAAGMLQYCCFENKNAATDYSDSTDFKEILNREYDPFVKSVESVVAFWALFSCVVWCAPSHEGLTGFCLSRRQ